MLNLDMKVVFEEVNLFVFNYVKYVSKLSELDDVGLCVVFVMLLML